MKAIIKKVVLLQLFIMAFAAGTIANSKNTDEKITVTFKVYGQCEECKERIEDGLQTKGITFAEWNVESKELTVTYKPDKITLDEIHKIINKIGYDTERSKATDEQNNKLPKCCQRGGH